MIRKSMKSFYVYRTSLPWIDALIVEKHLQEAELQALKGSWAEVVQEVQKLDLDV